MSDFDDKVKAAYEKTIAEADAQWDAFSRFIRANPKTGFAIGVALGFVLGAIVL